VVPLATGRGVASNKSWPRGACVCVCVCVCVCKAISLLYGYQKYQVCSSSSGQPASSLPTGAAYKHKFAIVLVPWEGKSVTAEFKFYLLLIYDKVKRV